MKKQFLSTKLKPIFKKYPVEVAYLFGSAAKRRTGPLSDLDIAVLFNYSVPEKQQQRLRYDIQNQIGAKLKMYEKVDVVPLNLAQPLLEREVVYDGKIIYNKNDAIRAHYEATAIGRWLDWKWYDDQFDRAILERLGKSNK
jgi:predicted nucleotidyltransferase